MAFKFTESVVEEACLRYFGQLGYAYQPALDMASDGVFAGLLSGEGVVEGMDKMDGVEKR